MSLSAEATSASTPSRRLKELGLALPVPASPSFTYVPAKIVGGLVYVAGQLPKVDGVVRITGTCGVDVTIEDAQEAARIATLQGISCAAAAVGGIDRLEGVLKVAGYVASAPDFHDQPKVINACSELLIEIFGPSAAHVRAALGVAALPRRSPVEIEFIFTTRE